MNETERNSDKAVSWDIAAESRAMQEQEGGIGSRAIIWVVALFLISGLLWAGWAELDEVTRGQGKVVPSSQLQVVQNMEGGDPGRDPGRGGAGGRPRSGVAQHRQHLLHLLVP